MTVTQGGVLLPNSINGGGGGSSNFAKKLGTYPDLITNDFVIVETDLIYNIDSVANDITITLPETVVSGTRLQFHHQNPGSNVVKIIDPNYPDTGFTVQNDIQNINCDFNALIGKPHWNISASVTNVNGDLMGVFKREIAVNLIATTFYITTTNIFDGRALIADPSLVQNGNEFFNYSPTGDVIIKKYYSPSLGLTSLKKGLFEGKIFAGLTTSPAPSTSYSLQIAIGICDQNGVNKEFFADSIDADQNEVLELNKVKPLNFTYNKINDSVIETTDRLELVVKIKPIGNVSQQNPVSVDVSFGLTQLCSLKTTIEQKDKLSANKIVIGDGDGIKTEALVTNELSLEYDNGDARATIVNSAVTNKTLEGLNPPNNLNDLLQTDSILQAFNKMATLIKDFKEFVEKAGEDISKNKLPIGSIVGFYGSTYKQFDNYLPMTRQLFSASEYDLLYQEMEEQGALTSDSTNLGKYFTTGGSDIYTPDFRSLYLKGLNNTPNGIDSNRTPFSIQQSQNKQIFLQDVTFSENLLYTSYPLEENYLIQRQGSNVLLNPDGNAEEVNVNNIPICWYVKAK